jgi:hypothetical protein
MRTPAGVDAQLLAAVDDFQRLTAEGQVWNARIKAEPDGNAGEEMMKGPAEKVWKAAYDSANRVACLPARTLEGMRAKASVAEVLLLEHHGRAIDEGIGDEEIVVALSLARDLRRGAAA